MIEETQITIIGISPNFFKCVSHAGAGHKLGDDSADQINLGFKVAVHTCDVL